jgi:hypothetical protein
MIAAAFLGYKRFNSHSRHRNDVLRREYILCGARYEFGETGHL